MAGPKPKLHRAIQLHRAGRVAEAEAICRSVLARHPDDLEAVNLLGILAAQSGRYDTAADCFRRVLERVPGNATALSNLGEALRQLGRPAEAIPLMQQAALLAPQLTGIHFRLARVLAEAGRTEEALAVCGARLRDNPSDADLNGLATDLLLPHRMAEAVPFLIAAIEQAPTDARWQQLEQVLVRLSLRLNPRIRSLLSQALAHPVVKPSEIALSVGRSLCEEPAIAPLIAAVDGDGLPQEADLFRALEPLAGDTLLRTLMETTFIRWPPLERLFTALRRALLLGGAAEDIPPTLLPLLTALATNAFLTDYAWFVTDEEAAATERLADRIEHALGSLALGSFEPNLRHIDGPLDSAPNEPDTHAIALLAAYRPLWGLAAAPAIAARAWPGPVADLVRLQVIEPLEERALRDSIPRIGTIEDATSREVRAQYEENPYPRWRRPHRVVAPGLVRDLAASLGTTLPANAGFETPDILIAGCGTGLQALSAASVYRDARILAVDLSLSSLAYAVRKTREAGVSGIEYAQADILGLGACGRRFHVIECCGVLHHLADPLAGWRVLVGLLRPGGLMHIALYSELARRAVVIGREHVARQGYGTGAEDIRRCRQDILALPDGHPLAALRQSRDLYNLNECRDLLFHVQEHRFTVPRIAEAVDALRLNFLGFVHVDAGAYRQRHPDDPGLRSMEYWDRWEQDHPDTFTAMYHFWVQKPVDQAF